MKTSSALNTLLEIASEPTSLRSLRDCILPCGLAALYQKNGFFAFESALEVFPVGESAKSYSISEWNHKDAWISSYGDLSPKGICFAQDLFGTQFLISDGIYSFDPETAETGDVAESIEAWVERILADYEMLTAQPIAHAWQAENGPLPKRSRLVPITPFVLGGSYDTSNLVAMDAVAAMRLRASLALQIRDLPDGTQVTYEVD